jgi:glycosyltransferase involved in cell wall biosynthesis
LVAALGKLDDGPELLLLGNPSTSSEAFEVGQQMNLVELSAGPSWHWQALRAFSSHHCDLYHSPSSAVVPLALGRRSVLTIHDLAPMDSPAVSTLKTRLTYLLLARAFSRCGRVIAVSQSTRDRIQSRWGPSDRIFVIPEAPRPLPDNTDQGCIAEILGAPDPYFLAVGTQEPRKNYETLVAAYEQAARRGSKLPRLVIAGKPGWGTTPRFLEAAVDRLSPRLAVLGFVSDQDLACLYSNARALIVPSLNEGFGLPAVEAMSLGCAIVASNRGALPEVLGDAALYFAPEDVGALRQTLLQVAKEDEVCFELKRRSISRSGQFSWEQTARKTVEVYRSLERQLQRPSLT